MSLLGQIPAGSLGVGPLPTEIYLPAVRHYPEGWSLAGCHEAAGCASRWDAETEILEILTPNQIARVELQITPDGKTPATIRGP